MVDTAILSMNDLVVAGGVTKPLRPVGGKWGSMGGTASGLSDGVSTSSTFSIWSKTPIDVGYTDIQVVLPNWYVTASADTDGPNAIPVKAALVVGSNVYKLYFQGQRNPTIGAGGQIVSDPLGIYIPPNTVFYVRTYVGPVTSGQKWPIGRTPYNVAAGVDGTNGSNGADAADSTANLTGGGFLANMYVPLAVIGKPSLPGTKAVLIAGDSIAAGSHDVPERTTGYSGFIEKKLANNVSWLTSTKSGDGIVNWYNSRQRRLAYSAPYVTSAIWQLAVNDIGNNIATLQSNVLEMWAELKVRGISVFATTITPLAATSTNGFITLANQTANANNSYRVTYNNWLRDGAPTVNGVAVAAGTAGALRAGQTGHPLAGYFEVADTIESARDSGIWAISPRARTVTDLVTGTNSTVTSATANFTSADLGHAIRIVGAGPSGATFTSWITSVTNSTTVVLNASTSTAIPGGTTAQIGGYTDDGLHPNKPAVDLMSTAIDLTRLK